MFDHTSPVRRPSSRAMLASLVAVVIIIGLMQAIPEMSAGTPASAAVGAVFTSLEFWRRTVLPVVIFLILFNLTFPWAWEKLIVRKDRGGRAAPGAFQRNRLLSTACGIWYLGIFGWGVWHRMAAGATLVAAVADLALMAVGAVVSAFFLLLAWVMPSEEKAKALESGDFRRVNDERHQLVAMRSAHTAVGVTIIGLLTVGSAAEILLYHTYPVRSFVEAGAVLVIWQVAYMFWNRRL